MDEIEAPVDVSHRPKQDGTTSSDEIDPEYTSMGSETVTF